MRDETGKAGLRATLLAARSGRTDGDGERCSALLAIPELRSARVVAGYAALPGEPDVGAALDALRRHGIRVLLPVVLAHRELEFRVYNGDLVDGRMGVRVPPPDAAVVALDEADVVLVPALAADRAGHRLGRGGGSYDRALVRVRPGALVIAVVDSKEVLASVPVESHDIRVGAVLAGDELIRVDS
jgi:5-formyltetrahydrofolate cyclo-ligase